MIEAHQLTKRYGEKTAVDRLDFTVRPGSVTGFLGPNGAGKSTTMRMIVGLDAPTAGTVTVNGRRYAEHASPLQEVGALLEAKSIHPGRSAFDHLMAQAYTHGIPRRRVDEVIELTGLRTVAKKRAGAFSLGMGQRLGIAAALLGDPATVMLDEPVNGLDPEGVLWIRNLLTALAAEGRTVFVSSHLMSEVALVAEHLIIVGRGRLLADTTVQELVRQAGGDTVKVATADPARLREVLAGPGVEITGRAGSEELQVTGLTPRSIGLTAAEHGIALFELTARAVSLEEAFMDLTRDAVEYHGTTTGIETPGRVA
ncbi:multidrug ABC transporter ATP-binding protein [Kitasatospora herbaricolor]|uniref:ABC transporter ATP-binding protein n=1 Tax=Kitasatospora herbaricolor TaxID=68217 RepID=UPI00174A985C|nr:ATP-binding cassette domain-containing protein [Kitasatospora herbaricolor]MDQ0312737.1 ABC-2 type transport system ATP-binding protein [Kitasatospora herbaricolor]GGV35461.1 multidrug ABC transporter ATP-binding protein [Kitasatospora herbaricolor]